MFKKFTWGAKKVGEDEFANSYYTRNNKRFVVYKGLCEPSKVPMHWHRWLHYSSDEIPNSESITNKFSWQKTHLPNLTGTKSAYNPNKTTTKKTNSSYESWQPQ